MIKSNKIKQRVAKYFQIKTCVQFNMETTNLNQNHVHNNSNGVWMKLAILQCQLILQYVQDPNYLTHMEVVLINSCLCGMDSLTQTIYMTLSHSDFKPIFHQANPKLRILYLILMWVGRAYALRKINSNKSGHNK